MSLTSEDTNKEDLRQLHIVLRRSALLRELLNFNERRGCFFRTTIHTTDDVPLQQHFSETTQQMIVLNAFSDLNLYCSSRAKPPPLYNSDIEGSNLGYKDNIL